MISLGLACAILDRDITYIDENKLEKSLTFYTDKGSFIGEYNIHEVAHKVKEWAYKNEYDLCSSLRECIITELFYEDDGSEMEGTYRGTFTDDFEAGQWILDNKDKQCN